MKKATYVGSDPLMKGKTALVRENPLRIRFNPPSIETAEELVMIQADNVSTGYGYGWHSFPAEDWEVETL